MYVNKVYIEKCLIIHSRYKNNINGYKHKI